MYYTKEEYIEYRERFLKFDDEFLAEVERKRKSDPISTSIPREYLVSHMLLPIKRILDKQYK